MGSLLSLLSLVGPIILEVLKIFWGPTPDKAKVAQEILDNLKRIRAALDKAEDTSGDTSDIEDIINKR